MFQIVLMRRNNVNIVSVNYDTTAISNKIKYDLVKSGGSFLEMRYSFYRYALLAGFAMACC